MKRLLLAGLVGVVLGRGFVIDTARAADAAFVYSVVSSAEDAYENGQGGRNVQKDFRGNVTLYDTTLIEDDGPGAGSEGKGVSEEQRSPVEEVNANTQLKKVLVVERTAALKAMLYVREGKATLTFNGTRLKGKGKFTPVPVELIRKGENELVISAEGDVTTEIKVAARRHILENNPELKDRPPRSFKSVDGGRAWHPIDGELTVRLNLTQFPAEGAFISPVLDLAGDKEGMLPLARVAIESVALAPDAETPAGTSVGILVRTGSTPVYEKGSWGDWQEAAAVRGSDSRFLQWEAVLKTTDARSTPVLKKVAMEAKVLRMRPEWINNVTVKGFSNEAIRYTSMPFQYEDPDHPKMKALREKYRLDEVVKDGKTELEKLTILRNWVTRRFKFKAPMGVYPPWDADAIMEAKSGFCVQFAIMYIQCANSLGYPARYVCGWHPNTMRTAHEVSEVWSNEYRKWILMDPTPSENRFYADPETGVPLSMLEVHDRMLRHYYGADKAAVPDNAPKRPSLTDDIAIVHGLDTKPGNFDISKDPASKTWPSWTKWLLLCYMPRNDFSAHPTPVPRIQGMNNWDWTGFRDWYDRQTPRDDRYAYHLSRRADISWTINQVCFCATPSERTGSLAMEMGTFTPNFDSYMVNVDGSGWKKRGKSFTWDLHPGRNRVEMRVRNTSGVEGPVSFVEADYAP